VPLRRLSSAPDDDPLLDALAATLNKAALALRDAEVEFMLGGSVASWVRGGPGPTQDIDLLVRPADAERALSALGRAGMSTERRAEDWFVKAHDGEIPVDVIFRPGGIVVDDGMFERADEIRVMAITMPVVSIDDLVITKLMVLNEHSLNLEPLLAIARAVREQIDWDLVRARTRQSPYATAFFTLVDELGLVARRGSR
jgi:predicted nucleotidyltransferase